MVDRWGRAVSHPSFREPELTLIFPVVWNSVRGTTARWHGKGGGGGGGGYFCLLFVYLPTVFFAVLKIDVV